MFVKSIPWSRVNCSKPSRENSLEISKVLRGSACLAAVDDDSLPLVLSSFVCWFFSFMMFCWDFKCEFVGRLFFSVLELLRIFFVRLDDLSRRRSREYSRFLDRSGLRSLFLEECFWRSIERSRRSYRDDASALLRFLSRLWLLFRRFKSLERLLLSLERLRLSRERRLSRLRERGILCFGIFYLKWKIKAIKLILSSETCH